MSSRVIHHGQGTDMEVSAHSRPHPSTVPALLGAAHPGPALAVTVLAALLGTALDLTPDRVVLVTAAVLCGQLSIGWSNDLVDLARDRAVGRSDKPLALGAISPRTVTVACAVGRRPVRRALAGVRLGRRAGAPRLHRGRLGLQPRPQGDGLVVGAVRRRVRRAARLRVAGR